MNCVVIPAYRAAGTILPVIAGIGPEIDLIVVVDDGCPEGTGVIVANKRTDPRVKVLMHDANEGVGGAFLTGMRYAIQRGADIVIKLDADGQMNPVQIPALIHPIASGQADYVKGDRFFFLTNAASMPAVRRLGNLALSFLAKLSTATGPSWIRPMASSRSMAASLSCWTTSASPGASSSRPICCFTSA
jgi:dolichol-phosphate mannosyltransferase